MRPGSRLIASRNISMNVFQHDREHGGIAAVFLDPYHLIRMDMEFHLPTRAIIGCSVEYVTHPYDVCPSVSDRAASLVGLVVERGVMNEIKRRLGGSEGCIHLRELATDVVNLAGTALVGYGSGFGLMSAEFNRRPPDERHRISLPVLGGSCRAYPGG